MIKRTLGCVAFCGWLMASGSLQAHHSLAGVYDMKNDKELSGTVVDVHDYGLASNQPSHCASGWSSSASARTCGSMSLTLLREV